MQNTVKTIKIPCIKFYDKVSHHTYEIPKKDFKDIKQIVHFTTWLNWGPPYYEKDEKWFKEIFFNRHLNILLTHDGRRYYVDGKEFNKIISSLGFFQGYSDKEIENI